MSSLYLLASSDCAYKHHHHDTGPHKNSTSMWLWHQWTLQQTQNIFVFCSIPLEGKDTNTGTLGNINWFHCKHHIMTLTKECFNWIFVSNNFYIYSIIVRFLSYILRFHHSLHPYLNQTWNIRINQCDMASIIIQNDTEWWLYFSHHTKNLIQKQIFHRGDYIINFIGNSWNKLKFYPFLDKFYWIKTSGFFVRVKSCRFPSNP